MNCRKKLITERLALRTLSLKDVTTDYINGLNDPEVNKYMVQVRANKQSRKTVESFVQGNSNAADAYLFGIFIKNSGKLIGTIRVHSISQFDYSCTVGICIFDKTNWNKGYASEGMKKVVEFLFDELGLHYIEAGCYQMNTASRTLFERAGFTVSAVIKNKYRYENAFVQVILLAKVNPRFKASRLKS